MNDLLTTKVSATLTIPTDDAVLIDGLNDLGALLTSGEWARAAIVAACVHVRPNGKGEIPAGKWSVTGFAALGISGLRSKQTIKRYMAAWQSTGLPVPVRGVPVDLPTHDFPASEPQTINDTGDFHLLNAQQQAAWILLSVSIDAVKAHPSWQRWQDNTDESGATTFTIPDTLDEAIPLLNELGEGQELMQAVKDAAQIAVNLGVFKSDDGIAAGLNLSWA